MSGRRSRAWLRHPPVVLRPPRPCPSEVPWFRSLARARDASAVLGVRWHADLEPVRCGTGHGWHLGECPVHPAA